MDLLYPKSSLTSCYSESELRDMAENSGELDASLKRHSHFFLPLPPSTRARPRSVPLMDRDSDDNPAASPMMTVLDDSSSERIDGVSVGCGEGEDTVNGTEKDGIR